LRGGGALGGGALGGGPALRGGGALGGGGGGAALRGGGAMGVLSAGGAAREDAFALPSRVWELVVGMVESAKSSKTNDRIGMSKKGEENKRRIRRSRNFILQSG
jgi:hypothetical protein